MIEGLIVYIMFVTTTSEYRSIRIYIRAYFFLPQFLSSSSLSQHKKIYEKKDNDEENFKFLYALDLGIKEKIEIISKEIYGADGVDFSPLASKQIEQCEKSGFGKLPICIAKTQYSFSCDPSAKGVPTGHRITVREIRSCVGAGFVYPICGDIVTIPGLPTRPGFYDVDIDTETGDVIGLF